MAWTRPGLRPICLTCPLNGAYDQAIRILGYCPDWGARLARVAGEERHSCRFVGFWCSSVVTLFVSAALPALAQRNNDASKQPTRSAQEQQDIQALVQTVELALLSDLGIQVPAPGAPPPQTPPTAKPLTFGAPDSSQGEVPDQVGVEPLRQRADRYLCSVHARPRSRESGIRRRALDPRGQRRAGGRVCHGGDDSSCQAARQQEPAASGPYNVRVGQRQLRGCAGRRQVVRGRSSSGPDSTWPTSPSRRRSAAAPAANQGNNRNNRNAAPPAAAAPGKVGLLRHEITVPDFSVADLTTSSVILATVGRAGRRTANGSGVESVRVRSDADRAVSRREVLEERRAERDLLDLWRAGGRDRQARRDDRVQLPSEAGRGREVLQQDRPATVERDRRCRPSSTSRPGISCRAVSWFRWAVSRPPTIGWRSRSPTRRRASQSRRTSISAFCRCKARARTRGTAREQKRARR